MIGHATCFVSRSTTIEKAFRSCLLGHVDDLVGREDHAVTDRADRAHRGVGEGAGQLVVCDRINPDPHVLFVTGLGHREPKLAELPDEPRGLVEVSANVLATIDTRATTGLDEVEISVLGMHGVTTRLAAHVHALNSTPTE